MMFMSKWSARWIAACVVVFGCCGVSWAGAPPWAGSRVGRTDEVLKPWTPVKASGSTISCWGRTYKWGATPFPNQVKTLGKDVLAGPIDVRATVDGREVGWKPSGAPKVVVSATGNLAKISRTMTGGGLVVKGMATVEFDGMIRVDFSVAASSSPVQVSSLVMDIPYNNEWATLMYYWPMDDGTWVSNAGAAPITTTSAKFRPEIWFGNEDGGLCWFAESDQGWKPSSANAAVEMLPQSDKFILRLHIWDVPRTISTAQRFTMGLQATPVKPWPKDYHKVFLNGDLFYGTETEARQAAYGKQVDAEWLQFQKDSSVTSLNFSSRWSNIQNYIVPGRPEEFKRIIDLTHAYGIKVMPYFGFEISNAAPEWDTYNEEVRVDPVISIFKIRHDYYPTMLEQDSYAACYKSHWADFMLEGILKAKKEYEFDGIYLDGTAAPWQCANPKHGCGYQKEDGTRSVTYPIFAVRDMMKRINKIFSNDAGEQVVAHVSGGPMVPTVSFATYYLDGEHVCNMSPKSNPLQTMPLEAFRAELMGRNWGVPILLLDNDTTSFSSMQLYSISLLHDVVPRSTLTIPGTTIAASYKKAFRDFGADDAQWLPYWKNSQYVSTSDVNVKVSMHKSRDQKLLVVISNLGDNDLPTASVTLALAKLGLPTNISASNAITGESIQMVGGNITLSLPKYKPVIVVVGAAKAARSDS